MADNDNSNSWGGNPYGGNLDSPTADAVKQARPDPAQVLQDLRSLKREFDDKAADYRRMSQAVAVAIELVEENRHKNAEAGAFAAAVDWARSALGAPGAAIKSEEFRIYADGSGSMDGARLEQTVDAIAALQAAVKAAGGQAPPAALWGDQKLVPLAEADLADPAARKKLHRSLNCGTDLAPSLSELQALSGSGEDRHLIIVSDGDVYDGNKALSLLAPALAGNKKLTVDFLVLIEPKSQGLTAMDKLVRDLRAMLPDQVDVRYVRPGKPGDMLKGLASLVTDRLAIAKTPQPEASAAPEKRRPPIPGMGG